MTATAGLMETAVRRFYSGMEREDCSDLLAVEEPLEIRLGFRQDGRLIYKPISITMRTPGDDLELAAGYLFTEAIVANPGQIADIRHCGPHAKEKNIQNTIVVELADGSDVDLKRLERHFYTSSSCGVCGKSSIEALYTGAGIIADSENPKIDAQFIHRLPAELRANQAAFEKTGGLHASALFKTDGSLDVLREDVGRHNALDKVIGAKLLDNNLPLSESVLMVSGRASFELVQKALMAGIPVLAAVGAPSSLAVELAREFGMTLIGFARADRFNIYCGSNRVNSNM